MIEYRRFTSAILETELGGGDPVPVEEDSIRVAPSFTDRVMVAVRRANARRRRWWRVWRAAAAALLFAGLSAGAFAWLGRGPAPDADLPELAMDVEEEPLAGVHPRTLISYLEPAEKTWWIIGPEQDRGRPRRSDPEAYLYGQGPREEAEGLRVLMLKALLGKSGSPGGSGELRLVMVPEGESGAEAIPLRPVSLPTRIAEGDLDAPARVRLHGPTRRYRILLWGTPSVPAAPDARTLRGENGSSPLRRPARELLPVLPQQY